jgi:predicted enzyme involved in methoxymalonyl-ACP biosynthesis
LDTLLMSCRVLRRGVEEFLFNELAVLARAEGAVFLTGEYLPSAKNGMVAGRLESFGFRREDSARAEPGREDGVRWRLAAADYTERRTHVRKEA